MISKRDYPWGLDDSVLVCFCFEHRQALFALGGERSKDIHSRTLIKCGRHAT